MVKEKGYLIEEPEPEPYSSSVERKDSTKDELDCELRNLFLLDQLFLLPPYSRTRLKELAAK